MTSYYYKIQEFYSRIYSRISTNYSLIFRLRNLHFQNISFKESKTKYYLFLAVDVTDTVDWFRKWIVSIRVKWTSLYFRADMLIWCVFTICTFVGKSTAYNFWVVCLNRCFSAPAQTLLSELCLLTITIYWAVSINIFAEECIEILMIRMFNWLLMQVNTMYNSNSNIITWMILSSERMW